MTPRGRPSRTAIHERLAQAVDELRRRLGGLPSPVEAQDIWTPIWHLEAHNSTALEGNTLVLREVEMLLSQGRAVGNKELKDYLEVRGYADAAQWVYAQAAEASEWCTGDVLTLTEVREVHRRLMTPVWEVAPHPMAGSDEGPGNWRRHNIQPFPGGMKPPPFPEIPTLIADWVAGIHEIRHDPSPIAEAVAARHAAFEQIHPFIDGNGRTGRLLVNLVFVRLGYPPAIVQKRDRSRYLTALNQADRGDPGALGELLARALLDNLHRFVMPAVAGPARALPLAALTTPEVTVRALRDAAERGRLRAIKDDRGQWQSSRNWVNAYVKTRQRRRKTPRIGVF
ncbi:MAG TPA: Fic family protein [Chloroflexota bacterium]|nr:Fic family protein [Chloroflexota bacterium]